MRRELRSAFRRVCWLGDLPALPDRPVVIVANHQSYHDGYLLWMFVTNVLERKFTVWMEEWDNFPFFGAIGALPFPPDAADIRGRSIRLTAERFRREPQSVLLWFPEGEQHSPNDDIREFAVEPMQRLHRVLGEPLWLPVCVHQTWRGESRPTALLSAGELTSAPTGNERDVLQQLRNTLLTTEDEGRVLLDGAASQNERWNFHWLARAFAPRS